MKLAFDAIGTKWLIETDMAITDAEWQAVSDVIRDRIERFDKIYSRFRDDSLVAKISRKTGTYSFPDDDEALFAFYRQLYEVTEGKVTPLIGDLLVEAGYDAHYSLRPRDTLHAVPAWDDVMAYRRPLLITKQPVTLDFGAAGKGYIVDVISELMNDTGINSFVIDASGDILRKTTQPDTIDIGLGHPTDETQAIGVAKLGNGSICGSGINRRQWAGLHHVMDPYVAKPVQSVIATWAMADTTLLADGMATALFLTDPAILQSIFTFEYCLVRQDFSYDHSPGFPATFFTKVSDESDR